VRDHGLTDRDTVRVQTLSGVLELSIGRDGRVSVDMGQPILEPHRVPFDATGLSPRAAGSDTLWPIELGEEVRWVSALSMGNPHAVLAVDDVERAPVQAEGTQIEHHRRFPRRVNVGFMQVTGPHAIALRVWERGVGETLACGTGACAAAVAALRQQRVASPVDVHMRGGVVSIAWQPGQSVRMIGPATTVFEGDIELQPDGSAERPPVTST